MIREQLPTLLRVTKLHNAVLLLNLMRLSLYTQEHAAKFQN
jgi:hypothetical protein